MRENVAAKIAAQKNLPPPEKLPEEKAAREDVVIGQLHWLYLSVMMRILLG